MKTDTKTLAAELRRYNAWRLGDWAEPMPEPQEITKMIDKAADRLEELERDLQILKEERSQLIGDDGRRSAELIRERALADRLRKSARALVDRWETPFWKDVPHTGEFIRSLEDALAAWKEARNPVPSEAEIDAHLDECIAKSALSWKPLPGDEP